MSFLSYVNFIYRNVQHVHVNHCMNSDYIVPNVVVSNFMNTCLNARLSSLNINLKFRHVLNTDVFLSVCVILLIYKPQRTTK